MKALALLITLGSMAAMANDKVAYVAEKLNSQGSYILCEQSSTRINPVDQRLYRVQPEESLNTMIGILKSNEIPEFTVSDLQIEHERACVILTKK